MGTPHFAVGILDALVQNNCNVVGVITAPDKPAGRGMKLNTSAVKDYAVEHQLKLLQPTNLKDESFLKELKSLEANCQVVVAFRMLPEAVWKMPQWGTFNLHASLLPQYRGAAPINWAIINGETRTGVTTFFIDEHIDTGAIILAKETSIEPHETAGELHDKLMLLGQEAVIETLHLIANHKAFPQKQEDTPTLKMAHKLHRENCQINWNAAGEQIYNLIRGLSPYPTAWTKFKDGNQEWSVKIYKAQWEPLQHSHTTGTVCTTKKEMKIAVKEGYLNVEELQFPGKKKMKTAELLNGMTFSEHTKVV